MAYINIILSGHILRKKQTRTSNYGSAGRSGHDSSRFYAGRIQQEANKPTSVVYEEQIVPETAINKIFCKSSESMQELPNASIHLVVTSPPYNVGKVYDEDMTLSEYRSFLNRVMSEVFRVLVPGGRLCINLANIGRKPYIPLATYITQDMISLGFLMRGQIIWDKGSSSGSSTAWGSWVSAANPTLRDIHEYILVFSKGMFERPKIPGRESTISREDFLDLTKSIWRFPAVSAKRAGHPAPFPVELPRRCIEMYTYENETILDPFMGVGTTALAAEKSRRKFVGYELNAEYIDIWESRSKLQN